MQLPVPLQAVESNIEELQQSIEEHQAELKIEMHTHLSAEERQELEDLTPRLKQLQVCWTMPAEASTGCLGGLFSSVPELHASLHVLCQNMLAVLQLCTWPLSGVCCKYISMRLAMRKALALRMLDICK